MHFQFKRKPSIFASNFYPSRMLKKILLGVAVLLIAIQFVRPAKNTGTLVSSTDITNVVNVPENIKNILHAACYDCHSNSTSYPWYSTIMPFGWWLNHHVKEGKEHLNFSEFATYSTKKQDHKLEETSEEVEEHEMPLSSYTIVHPEAKLTEEQILALEAWVKEARAEINIAR